MLMRLVDWFFRERHTGQIVIAQWPNWPLWIFVAASLVGPTGPIGIGARAIEVVSLVIWAGDELLRGVNLWRCCLGAAVLIGLASGSLSDQLRPSTRSCSAQDAGRSTRSRMPIPRGNRPTTIAVTMPGASCACDSVMRTERSVMLSRQSRPYHRGVPP